jgi:two-component system sensor histidine kinase CreC
MTPSLRGLLFVVGAIGLILFATFVASRLLRARRSGLSIRMQVFLALAVIVGAFGVGLGVLVVDRLEARTTLLAESAAREEAQLIAALVGSEVRSRGGGLEQLGASILADAPRGTAGFRLADRAGRIVFATGPEPELPGTVEVRETIVVDGVEVGSVLVVKPTVVVQRLLADLSPTVLVLATLLGSVAALAAALIGGTIAKPLEALTAFAERVSAGDRRAMPPVPQGREVRLLTHALESMRRELEGRPFVETFAADLSHELKNPVAVVRASAEVLADGALEEPEEATKFVGRIVEATTRIELLLAELLSLARIESRGLDEAEPVDLGSLVGDCVARLPEGLVLAVVPFAPCLVRGDAGWLGRALDNLLQNALVHGDPGAPIVVRLVREGDTARLSVESQGAIPRHVGKQLFRRFVTTRREQGGTGLGLAIVRAIAEAHRGTAECARMGPPTVELVVTLPLD